MKASVVERKLICEKINSLIHFSQIRPPWEYCAAFYESIRHNKIVNPGTVTATYPVAAIGIDQVSDTVVSNNEVIISKGNTSKSVYLLGGCDPDTVRIDNNPTSHTP